jgi:hypothetical protein
VAQIHRRHRQRFFLTKSLRQIMTNRILRPRNAMSAEKIRPLTRGVTPGCASISSLFRSGFNQPAVTLFCHRQGIIQRFFDSGYQE